MDATTNTYSMRRLQPSDIASYKAIRLEALKLEPGMFGNSYSKEAAFTEEEWMSRLNNPNSACFGLYHNDELIGITGIFVEAAKLDEGYMTQSYIRKEYRGQRLSRLLYQVRIEWANEHNVKKLIIGHRESNIVSRSANQHFGFVYSHSELRSWPDGSTEDMLYYFLEL